jgi:hypothetical protein
MFKTYRRSHRLVSSQQSAVRGQRSEVRGQRSEVRSQKSEVRKAVAPKGTLQESPSHSFNPTRFRLTVARAKGVYYLAYLVTDC